MNVLFQMDKMVPFMVEVRLFGLQSGSEVGIAIEHPEILIQPLFAPRLQGRWDFLG